jgi:hypothetical protein
MLKVGQGLTLQQSPKHPILVSKFLHGHQVLNLTEGYHPLDPLLWASIQVESKLSGVLVGWVVWIHEKLKLDLFRLVRIKLINLVYLLHPGNKRNWGGGGGSCVHKEAKQRRIRKTYSYLLSRLIWLNRIENIQSC